MSTPPPAYDEVGSRTRQAWLRTNLGVLAVALLSMRSLLLADAPSWAIVACLVPAAAFTVIAVIRTMRVNHAESEHATAATGYSVVASVAGLVVIAVMAVLLGTSAGVL
jgi:uncharacterized membrane protein YjfL (UPF0719 family)